MHVQADLLNNIRNFRESEGEILKSSSNTTVMGRIRDRNAICRELGVSIHRCAAWPAVTHTITLQNI
jgi:hypothetical protein